SEKSRVLGQLRHCVARAFLAMSEYLNNLWVFKDVRQPIDDAVYHYIDVHPCTYVFTHVYWSSVGHGHFGTAAEGCPAVTNVTNGGGPHAQERQCQNRPPHRPR